MNVYVVVDSNGVVWGVYTKRKDAEKKRRDENKIWFGETVHIEKMILNV